MGLKLCYIFTSAGLKSDSVQKKVIAQINALTACGVKCRGLFFTKDVQTETAFNAHIVLIPYPATNRKYFNIISQKRQLVKEVSAYIIRTTTPDEYLYIRYPGASFELYQFARRFQHRLVSEHQAKEIDEILSFTDEHPFGLRPSKILSYFLYRIWPVYNELVWGKLYSRFLIAKVAVTSEIAGYHRKNCKNVWMISNGIETQNYSIRQAPELENELRIIFLKGTSGFSPWNGLDRLISSIDQFHSDSARIQLIICGNIIEGEIPDRSYIVQTGYLDTEGLNKLFSNVHIGFSTLCLYRKNLKEAAVLKAREYFTRGLPFVYAYIDPDLVEGDPINQFALQIPNDNSLIDMDQVMDFAKRTAADYLHPEKMRLFAEKKLDWKGKMNELKNHLIAYIN